MRILPHPFSSFFIPISANLAFLSFLLPFFLSPSLMYPFYKNDIFTLYESTFFFICTINIGIPIFVYPSEKKGKISRTRISLA